MSQDVRNAAERLRKQLRAAQYPELNAVRLEAGDVSDLLRILHFILLDSSRAVAQFLVDKGYDLYGKTDARFVESAFRLLRDEFRCFPSLSVTQFLSKQFVARKLSIVADAAATVAQKRQELQRRKRSEEAVWSQPQRINRRREIKPIVENHVLPTTVTNQAASILQHLKLPQTEEGRRVMDEEMMAPPAPVFTGRQMDTRSVQFAREIERSEDVDEVCAVDDSVQTDSRFPLHQPKSCCCSQDSGRLEKAVGDLSRQLSEMSSALMSKISSVENRLGRLEDQVHGVQTAIEEQRELTKRAKSAHSMRMENESPIRGRSDLPLTDKRRPLDVEATCAWPPQPSVFERY